MRRESNSRFGKLYRRSQERRESGTSRSRRAAVQRVQQRVRQGSVQSRVVGSKGRVRKRSWACRMHGCIS